MLGWRLHHTTALFTSTSPAPPVGPTRPPPLCSLHAHEPHEPTPAHGRRSGEYLTNGSTTWYDERDNIEIFIGDKVDKIDTQNKVVTSEKGRSVPYDAVVLATGSYPFMPPLQGNDQPGVFVYRTIDDLERMIAYQKEHNVKAAAVIGGGLLGLEAAKAAFDLGMDAHIMEYGELPEIPPPAAGRLPPRATTTTPPSNTPLPPRRRLFHHQPDLTARGPPPPTTTPRPASADPHVSPD